MYDKFLKGLIKNLIEKHFNETAFKEEIELRGDTGLLSFEVETVGKNADFHTYYGFLGSVGNLVVTAIDDNQLEIESFIEIT